MDIITALLTRRSIRRYQPTPIPDQDVEEILACAMAAPSAINAQHWYFVVVKSEARRRELAEVMGQVAGKFRPLLEARFASHPEVVDETQEFIAHLGGAPLCVLAFFLKPDFPDRDGAMQSVSAAVENMLLAAWGKGIGSCWLSAAQRIGFGAELAQRFAPGKGEFVAAITLGYPAVTPKMPPRRAGRYTTI